MTTLNANKRSKADKLETLRSNGNIPAVVYGVRVENTPISVPIVAFTKAFREVGESSTIVLDIEGKKIDVLIHEVQVDSITSKPTHVDFLVIDMNKKINVEVALEFTGVSSAVKTGLGTLVKVLHGIEVEALPKDLPHSISVDISKLADLNSQILVSDLVVPAGVSIITKDTEVVASIAEQKEEKEEASAPVDLSAIEVEKKGKKEEEGAPAEAK